MFSIPNGKSHFSGHIAKADGNTLVPGKGGVVIYLWVDNLQATTEVSAAGDTTFTV
jgi:hypothetical protein